MPVEGTSTHAIERVSFSAAHRFDRRTGAPNAVAPEHTPRLRAAAMMPGVPRQRDPGEAGERSANTKRENALQNDRAARVVASRAVDAGDCRDLLDMLGLDADAARAEHRRS